MPVSTAGNCSEYTPAENAELQLAPPQLWWRQLGTAPSNVLPHTAPGQTTLLRRKKTSLVTVDAEP